MNSRRKLLHTLSFGGDLPPPRYENEFHEDVLESWRDGPLAGRSVEEAFGLEQREALPVHWRRERGQKLVVREQADLECFRQTYDPDDSSRLPAEWATQLAGWRTRDFALSVTPWSEGLLQVIGIGDWASFCQALDLLYERPALAEAMMEYYADYLVRLIDRVMAALEDPGFIEGHGGGREPSGIKPDYAMFYEAIASNHSPIVSPEMYARFALPALRRVIDCLDGHGVAHRFVWSSGNVSPLLPLWLDAGINGLSITQTVASGISFLDLRRRLEPRLRLFGGVDWEAVMQGPAAIDETLRETVRPLLEQGGYVPHLDDRIRPYLPFENYQYYRGQLDTLIDDVYGLTSQPPPAEEQEQ